MTVIQYYPVQVIVFGAVCLGLLKPCRIDFGLVGYLDLPRCARSLQARLPVVGKGDGHSGLAFVGGIIVNGICLAGQKTADLQSARDDFFHKDRSVCGRGRRILVVHDRLGQAAARDIDDGLPRDLHAVLVDIRHGLVDVSDTRVGNDNALSPV